jgi:3-oxoacyl-[acyl-carrier protein] reductase
MRLDNRVAIITGGANGIGKATALRFAAEKGQVAIWDLADEAGQALQSVIRASGCQARYQHVDVTDIAAVEAAVQELLQDWGKIDILVNNAGITRDAQLIKYKDGQIVSSMSTGDFDAVLSINLKGVFVCTRAVAPSMIRQKYGRIVNTSSVVGLYGNFGQTNYVASKAGVIGMTRVWARELGRYNITVNSVAPGFIDTEMTRHMPEKIRETIIAHTPMQRMGQPEDVANAFLFLASEEASYISGAVLSVDGGIVLGT